MKALCCFLNYKTISLTEGYMYNNNVILSTDVNIVRQQCVCEMRVVVLVGYTYTVITTIT